MRPSNGSRAEAELHGYWSSSSWGYWARSCTGWSCLRKTDRRTRCTGTLAMISTGADLRAVHARHQPSEWAPRRRNWFDPRDGVGATPCALWRGPRGHQRDTGDTTEGRRAAMDRSVDGIGPPRPRSVPATVESATAFKTCPDCAEEVRAAARKCRFCGYIFASESDPQSAAPAH